MKERLENYRSLLITDVYINSISDKAYCYVIIAYESSIYSRDINFHPNQSLNLVLSCDYP